MDRAHTRTDVAAYLAYLEHVRRYSANTIRSYRYSLDLYAAHLRKRHRSARTATLDDVIGFANTLSGQAARTVRNRLAAVRGFHTFLHATGRADRNVAALVGGPKIPDTHERTHTRAEVEHVREHLTSRRDRAVFALLYAACLRCEGARTARLDMLDHENRTLTVVEKGRRRRTVPLDDETYRLLLEYIEHERGASVSPYIFRSQRKGADVPLGDYSVRYMLHRAAERAGFDRLHWTPHTLRRAGAEHMRGRGVDPFVIQRMMGHRRLSETSGYVAPPLTPETLRFERAPDRGDLRPKLVNVATRPSSVRRVETPLRPLH